MWEMAVDDSIAKLLGTTKSGNLSYFGVSNYGRLDAKQVLLNPCCHAEPQNRNLTPSAAAAGVP